MVTEFDVSIKIVTDSTSDIPIDLASSLGITIVPGYVRFGNDTYRDGTDISAEAFYQKLVNSPFHQITSEPTPDDFEKVYSDCSLEAEHIISIHASSKVSKILKSAIAAKKRIKGPCHIEIIDSRSISIGLGLIVENAARLSNSGDSIVSILDQINGDLNNIRMLGVLSTMKYLIKGRRVIKISAALSHVLDIKPVLTFDNGEIIQDGIVHGDSPSRVIERLYEFVQTYANVQDITIAHGNTSDLTEALIERLGVIFPKEKIHLYHLGAALGVHSGPGALIVALRQGN